MVEAIRTDHDIVGSEDPDTGQVRLAGDLIDILGPDESMSSGVLIDIARIARRFRRIGLARIAFMSRICSGVLRRLRPMLLAGGEGTGEENARHDQGNECLAHIVYNLKTWSQVASQPKI